MTEINSQVIKCSVDLISTSNKAKIKNMFGRGCDPILGQRLQ